MATHSSVLAWRIPGTAEPGGCRLWGRTESDTTEVTQQQQFFTTFPQRTQTKMITGLGTEVAQGTQKKEFLWQKKWRMQICEMK